MSSPDLGYTEHDLARDPAHDDPADDRHPFARDYDRLVHASALRNLQGKTQVVAPREAEFLRTRLTHTIEVAQLARRMAERVGAHPDACESAAVLHDFGHPPFGHIGEEALCAAVDEVAAEWGTDPADVGGYEGNAQNFRLVTARLSGSGAFGGLNLTRTVLDGALKYPWTRAESTNSKWCFYPTELEAAGRVRDGVPEERRRSQSFEAQVVDWADDVAYSVHDLEDWYRAGLIPLGLLSQSDVARGHLANELIERRRRRHKLDDTDALVALVDAVFTDPDGPFAPFATLGVEYDGSVAAKHALRVMRKRIFERYARTPVPAIDAAPARRHLNDLAIPSEARAVNDLLRDLIWIYVIDHPRTATYQLGQRRIVEELYRIHADAVRDGRSDIFPRDLQPEVAALVARADGDGSSVEVLRLVADHVADLTDAGAARLHRRLTGAEDSPYFAYD